MIGLNGISKMARRRMLLPKATSYTGTAASPTYLDSKNLFSGTKHAAVKDVANTVAVRRKRFLVFAHSRRNPGLNLSGPKYRADLLARTCISSNEARVP